MNTQPTNPIVSVTCQLDEQRIDVRNEHTIYFDEYKAEEIAIPALIKRHNALVKKARANKISVSLKYKTKQQLADIQQEYQNVYQRYQQLFAELLAGVKNKINKGIIAPTCDDMELHALYNIRREITPMFYHSGVLGKVADLNRTIVDAEERVNLLIKKQNEPTFISGKIYL